jgi:hypothetical protein
MLLRFYFSSTLQLHRIPRQRIKSVVQRRLQLQLEKVQNLKHDRIIHLENNRSRIQKKLNKEHVSTFYLLLFF